MHPMRRTSRTAGRGRLAILGLAAFLSATCLSALGSEVVAADTPAMGNGHQAFFKAYCLSCHDAATQEGGMRLDDLPSSLDTVAAATRWQRVLDQLNSGSMPPDDADQPSPAEKTELLDRLSTVLAAARKALADGGGVSVMRRLNRREYGNTIWSLLGVEVDVRTLPADAVADGFDTAGSALFMSSEQFGLYKELGREAVDAAFEQARGVANPRKDRIEAEDMTTPAMIRQLGATVDYHRRNKTWMSEVDKAAARPEYAARVKELKQQAGTKWWEFYWHWDEFKGAPSPKEYGFPDAYEAYLGDRLWETITTQGAHYLSLSEVKTGAYLGLFSSVRNFSQVITIHPGKPRGTYRIRVRLGAAENAPPDRRFVELAPQGPMNTHIGTYHVRGTIKEPRELEILVRKSKTTPGQFALKENRANTGNGRAFYDAEFKRNGVGPDYVIWVDWHEVEGPIITPENEAAIRSMQAVIARIEPFEKKKTVGGSIEADESAVVRDVIESFAMRACRGQPPAPPFVDKLCGLYRARRTAGEPPLEAIREPLAVVLASPRFLYLYEPTDGDGREPLTQLELATRLAYLLWSGPPDDVLLDLARQGRLADPEVLRGEVDRLLGDPRVKNFVHAFVHQWLSLSRLDFFRFDQTLYPKFDVGMKESARSEVIETFAHVLASGGSLRRLLASDTVVVDALLADFYGIPGVEGDAFQEVPVPAGSPRGGLLGMTAIMAMGSDGTNTSPVERGAWVLRKLCNDPPPPAPPNVPELKRIATGMTVRERLRLHQEEPQCAQCHRKIDPVGFGLENFDAVGQWRTEDRQPGLPAAKAAIDPAGAFHRGPAFHDFYELRELIAAQPERFARGFTSALIAYALGRPFSFVDEELAESMVSGAAANNFVVRDFVHRVVASKAFQTK